MTYRTTHRTLQALRSCCHEHHVIFPTQHYVVPFCRYAVTSTVGSRVGKLNPAWNSPKSDTDVRHHTYASNPRTRVSIRYHTWPFHHLSFCSCACAQALFAKAMNLVGEEFVDKLLYYYNTWLPARSIVEQAVRGRFEVGQYQDSVAINVMV